MSSGAPTGKWESLPPHLAEAASFELRRAEAKLLVRRPGVPETTLPIEKPEFVIGRERSGVDLTLDDDLVSRRHARLIVDARGYFRLEDLGSQNAIRFQGRPVRRLNLVDGDTFAIGRTEFVFHAKMNRFGGTPPTRGAAPRASSDVDVPDPAGFDAPAEPELGDDDAP
jgi:hypothetical protein